MHAYTVGNGLSTVRAAVPVRTVTATTATQNARHLPRLPSPSRREKVHVSERDVVMKQNRHNTADEMN